MSSTVGELREGYESALDSCVEEPDPEVLTADLMFDVNGATQRHCC